MAMERRSTFKVVKAGDSAEDYLGDDAVTHHVDAGEPRVTFMSVVVGVFFGLAAGGVSYGFFDYLHTWVHVLVAFVSFGLMVAYGRRMATGD